MSNTPTTVGERLLKAFSEKGITSKKAIAEVLGFKSDKSVYKIIRDEQELSFDALRRFSEITGKSIDWLLFGGNSCGHIDRDPKRRESNDDLSSLRNEFADMLEEWAEKVRSGGRP